MHTYIKVWNDFGYMKLVCVCSSDDEAGLNISRHLPPTLQTITLQQPTIFAEHIDQTLQADVIIFITKHDSQSKIPSFCVHTQGNWSSNDLGGQPYSIGRCPIVLKNKLYATLSKRASHSQYDVVNEATHHGPELTTPSVFIEIGSTPTEWAMPENGKLIASVIKEVLDTYTGEHNPQQTNCVFGIGGTHTCANWNTLAANETILLGHVCPNYKVLDLTVDTLLQGMNRNTLPCQVVVDWKALNAQQRAHVTQTCELAQVSFIKLKELKNSLLKSLILDEKLL